MLRLLTTIGVGLLVASTSFAQTSRPNPATSPAETTVPKLDQQDSNFIKEAAAGGMAEVELSKIATKSVNPEVKRFAERMVRDHRSAGTELTGIATELGATVPKSFDTNHQKIRDQLANMHGPAFDRQYMQIMVDDHDQAVKLFRQEISSSHDPRLKQFAQKVLPTIEEHQKMALDLSGRLSKTAAQ